MGKIPDLTAPEALHGELCAAIADLARSVDVAVTHLALRAKCTITIADATKTERAAEALRDAARRTAESLKPQQTTLVPELPATANLRQEDNWSPLVPRSEAVDELYAACNWLVTAQASSDAPIQRSGDSAIATRMLELHNRLGGLIK
jgi:hypothetical protein